MKQELLKKIQILESLCGHLRREYEFGLEADEVFAMLKLKRDEYMDKLQDIAVREAMPQTQKEMLRYFD